jgi:hypothetical protein
MADPSCRCCCRYGVYPQAKIYAVGWVLWAAGKTKEANLLKTAFKAFNVYNSRRYDRESAGCFAPTACYARGCAH